MPTGPKHQRFSSEADHADEDCRCMIGEDHEGDGSGESLSVDDAADIWMSNGMDEDYSFGYSESELRRAAGQS